MMQLDDFPCEGINDSFTTSKPSDLETSGKDEINLEKHFTNHGLSKQAHAKMSNDVANGDINEMTMS